MSDAGTESLGEGETRRAAVFDAAPNPVIAIDDGGRVIDINLAAISAFGLRREDVIGGNLVDLIAPPRARTQLRARLARFRATGTSALLGKRLRGLAVRSDGTEFPVELIAQRLPTTGPPELAIYLNDITRRRQAETQLTSYQGRLRSLAAELLLIEERERRRLAADLHDGLSQTIALVQIKLAALRFPSDPALQATLDDLAGLMSDALRSARSITFELTPPILHDVGLEPAVEWLLENIQLRYRIEIGFENDRKPKPVDERVRIILFRSIRELLINAAKHASAKRVLVRLARERGGVEVAVEDDGVGMDPDVALVMGSGLFSIRERMHHVGGSMRIESARGRGTRIRLSAPLADPFSAAAEVVL